MTNVFNFHKPKTAAQWIIFLAAVGISLSSPYGTRRFFKELDKYLSEKRSDEREFDKRKLTQALYYLKKRKIIEFKENSGKIILVLTEKGKKRKLDYDFEAMQIQKQQTWDKKWRLLMFDIPEFKKSAREMFRDKLKEIGFIQFQKSVWIHPFPCENEIDFISEYFSIAPYITFLTVNIENDVPLRRSFDLI